MWKLWPAAETFVCNLLREFVGASEIFANFEKELLEKTGTNLIDWMDGILISEEKVDLETLKTLGYGTAEGSQIKNMRHKNAQLPRIVFIERKVKNSAVYVKCDSIRAFRAYWESGGLQPELVKGSQVGLCCITKDNGWELWGVERHACLDYEERFFTYEISRATKSAVFLWKHRPRVFEDDSLGMDYTLALVRHLVNSMSWMGGNHLLADYLMAEERAYWQSRNKIAGLQKEWQDELGLGWANHDHHTFRSSRQHFRKLIEIFETLGFRCRERFYAGEEAGWGAQVLENRVAGITIFADVDLMPEETEIDFAHQPLAPKKELGTIGLWCALHGESILQAGMHHLEIQCNFEIFRKMMEKYNVEVMSPFNNEPHLRQAFTKGEVWPVSRQRLEKILKEGLIDELQFKKFAVEGAVGSHLEHLERHCGYKGFRQEGVSQIIKETDPRKN